MNKYAAMYKKQRTIIEAVSPWNARTQAAVHFGLTKGQIAGVGLELISREGEPYDHKYYPNRQELKKENNNGETMR